MKTILHLAFASLFLLCLPAFAKAQSSNIIDVMKSTHAYERSLKGAAYCPSHYITGMESSSNGLGGGETLCNHPYDFDDYVNTFRAWLNVSTSPGITLHYQLWDFNGVVAASGTIYNFSDTQQYALPPTMPVGQYWLLAWVTTPDCAEYEEWSLGVTYANCGGGK